MTKFTSPALTKLLATRQFFTAKLFTFTLVDGTVLKYCSGDKDITVIPDLYQIPELYAYGDLYGPGTYSCGGQTGPYFERSNNKAKSHLKIGTATDTLILDVLPGTSTVKGFPFLSAVLYGVFDGATVLYQKAYMPTYGDASGGLYNMFQGRVGDVNIGRKSVTFTINSGLELLNQNLPRTFYQPGCNNTLFDTNCTLNAATFAVAGAVLAGSNAGMILSSLTNATGYFDLGKLTFTSGALNTFSVGVKSWTTPAGVVPGVFQMNRPFPVAPSVGDTFNAYPGCDKLQATCTAKFNNAANFRGTPFVPIPETAG